MMNNLESRMEKSFTRLKGNYLDSYVKCYREEIKPLEKILDNFKEWFNIKFDKKGITLINKNLNASFA